MSIYDSVLDELENYFNILHKSVDKPKYMTISNHNVFRYENKTPEIAMIQFMARIISGLYSSKILIENGLIQECNLIFRTLDEFDQNILFLSQLLIKNTTTELHQRFLNNFFAEEFDEDKSPFDSKQKRDIVPRDKIRAFISKIDENPANPSDTQKICETIDKFYSGFIHGTSTHIIKMYSDTLSQYHLSGLPPEVPSAQEAQKDFENYLHRSIFSLKLIALSFKNNNIFERLKELNFHFEQETNRTEWEDPEFMIKKLKQKV